MWKLPEARVFRSCFCARCGGLVPNPDPPAGTERLCIPAGALDDDPGARPRFHIFWGSRVAWSEATDSLARFEAYPE